MGVNDLAGGGGVEGWVCQELGSFMSSFSSMGKMGWSQCKVVLLSGSDHSKGTCVSIRVGYLMLSSPSGAWGARTRHATAPGSCRSMEY